MKKITYTFPDAAEIPAPLRGKTFTGGVPTMMRGEQIVMFAEKIDRKAVAARVAGKPELAAEVARYEAELAADRQAKQDQFLVALPGIEILREAQRLAQDDEGRYHGQLHAMMEDGSNDGARPPKPIDESLSVRAAELAAQYPRAALYLKAERQAESAHWADNSGKGAAGRNAMAILVDGGRMEDASAALAVRRELID